MQCPYCQTENREDRERCYACDKDISMLRLLVNKARHHYNDALEHAERGRPTEAIDELRNAIDLDRRFAAAHVVLGTLYAKQDEYDKARASWDNARALQPELAKAHSYLQRVQAVENSLPALRTARWIVGVLLGLVLLLAIGLGVSLRPDANEKRLADALAYYQEQRYGRALRDLDHVTRNSRRGSAVFLGAQSLRHALQADLRQQIRHIQELKYEDRYEEALTAIAEIESQQPDSATSAALATIRQDIVHYYREEIKLLYQDVENELADYETLLEHVNRFLELYPEAPERDEFQAYLDRGRAVQVDREVERLRADFAQSRDYLKARNGLAKLTAQYGTVLLAGGRPDLVDEILTVMFEGFTRAVESRNFEQAERLLAEIADSSSEFKDVIDVTGHVGLARRVLTDARRTWVLRLAEEAVESGNVDAAEEALFHLAAEPDLTGAELDMLAKLETQLAALKDQVPLPDLVPAENQRFLSLEISDDEASATLTNLDQWIGRAGDSESQQALLARGIASAVKLKDRDAATSITKRLEALGAPQSLLRELPKFPTPKPTPTPRAEATATPRGSTIVEPVEGEDQEAPTPTPRTSSRRRSR